jgi:hypothetical protein
MFTIILAVLLAVAIVWIGYSTVTERTLRFALDYLIDVNLDLVEENTGLRRKLDRRRERHQRASRHIVTQRAQLREKEAELERAGIWIRYFFKIFDSSGIKIDDIHITRKEARNLFVA